MSEFLSDIVIMRSGTLVQRKLPGVVYNYYTTEIEFAKIDISSGLLLRILFCFN